MLHLTSNHTLGYIKIDAFDYNSPRIFITSINIKEFSCTRSPIYGGGNKYETKDEAWKVIAMKLRSNVETCKKRWKYLRERYVSQRKQGDPPVYEHLSRPYLEKMKFLDQHIQPRKSYRNVPNFLTSPHSANSSNFIDYNMDSKSNSSMKNLNHFGGHSHHYHQQSDQQHAMNALSSAAVAASALENDNRVKIEADQVFRDFAAAVASQ
uniref:MADF domain-containing protein n=1 Tax=Glossina palpalis gambiensis TaxID=67801 RepID=A0A1B0C2R4_9MUSC